MRACESGPQRGHGRPPVGHILETLSAAHSAPKRGRGKPPEITPVKPIEVKKAVKVEKQVVKASEILRKSPIEDGPRRGYGIGPGALPYQSYIKKSADKAADGPKRGIGIMPGVAPGMTFNFAGEANVTLCMKLVNEFRAKHKLPPVKFNKQLAEIARPHSEDMLAGRVPLGHEGFDKRFKAAVGFQSAAENVGYCSGFANPVEVMVKGWIDSPPHRKNMLGDFNQLGIAFANRGTTWYGTQFFGRQ